jgi:error-prone DNA polymerase
MTLQPLPHLAHIRGLPECQVILLPEYGAQANSIAVSARWLSLLAPGRTSIAMTLHYRADDETHKANVTAALHFSFCRCYGRRGYARPIVQACAGRHDGHPTSPAGSPVRISSPRMPKATFDHAYD